MDLDRYEAECASHAAEILVEIRSFGIARLHALCCTAGTAQATAYLQRTDTGWHEYLCATPARRKSLLRKVPEQERGLFLLAAAYRVRCALALLTVVCSKGVTAGPGYRMITAQAAAAAEELQAGWPSLWPFEEEEDLEDPFGGT